MLKVVSIVGARPQFVKAGIVSKNLRSAGFKEIFLHTGQHYDYNMSKVFFKELSLPQPDYYLGIGSGSHAKQVGNMLIRIEEVLLRELPDIVFVYGDTNSTLAGALAAAKLNIPVAHVEAGLRSYNRKMPEEINRVLTDHISEILFAPTDVAVENLRKEGITKGVYKVGDVMLDVALEVANKVNEEEVLNRYALEPKNFILVTIHRAENTIKETFLQIWKALNEIAKSGIKLFFPVHPRTKNVIEELELIPESKNFVLSEPVSYFEMVALERNAKVIITDSGGVQKEGFFFGTPCVIPREETEWIELVNIGFNKLTGVNTSKICDNVRELWNRNIGVKEFFKNIYGNGKASEKICEVLKKWINQK